MRVTFDFECGPPQRRGRSSCSSPAGRRTHEKLDLRLWKQRQWGGWVWMTGSDWTVQFGCWAKSERKGLTGAAHSAARPRKPQIWVCSLRIWPYKNKSGWQRVARRSHREGRVRKFNLGERSTTSHSQGALTKQNELRLLAGVLGARSFFSSPSSLPSQHHLLTRVEWKMGEWEWMLARVTCTTERSTEVSDTHTCQHHGVEQEKKHPS